MNQPDPLLAAIAPPKEGTGEWPIFISYRRSSLTSEIAKWLKEQLEDQPIQALNEQWFSLNVFVDALEPVHGDFQEFLVPHLRHSRMLVVIADKGAVTRRPAGQKDYLYEELDWWQRNRPNNPPILLDTDRVSASALTGSDPRFSGWVKQSWLECFWEEWRSAGIERFAKEQSWLCSVLRDTIRTYGHDIHLAEVRKLKRLVKGLCAVAAALLITAIAIGVLARQLNRTLESSERRRYAVSLNAATMALNTEDLPAARTALRESPEQLRGWEWRHLNFQADSSERNWLGHEGGSATVIFSADDSKIFSSGRDGSVKVWDSNTATRLAILETPSEPLPGNDAEQAALREAGEKEAPPPLGPLALSPDGKQLAAGSSRGKIFEWDTETWKELRRIGNAHDGHIADLAYQAPSLLLSAGQDGILNSWSMAGSKPSCKLLEDFRDQTQMAISGDGGHLAVCFGAPTDAGAGSKLRTFSIEEGENLQLLRNGTISPDMVGDVVFANPGHTAVVADFQGRLVFLPEEKDQKPEFVSAIPEHTIGNLPLVALAASPDGSQIASGAQNGMIKLWDAEARKVTKTLPGHPATVKGLAFSHSGKRLASASSDGSLRLWDLKPDASANQKVEVGFDIWSMTVAPDGKSFIVAGESGKILRLAADGITVLARDDQGSGNRIDFLCHSPDGQTLLAIDESGILSLRKAKQPEEIIKEDAERDSKATTAFFLSNTEVILLSEDGSIERLDGRDLHKLGDVIRAAENGATATCSIPGTSNLLVARTGGSVEIISACGTVWDKLSGGPNSVSCLTVSADGTMAAAAGGTELCWWTLGNRKLKLRVKAAHEELIRTIAFNQDGSRLWSGSQDCTAKIWETQDGLSLFRSEARSGIIDGVGFLNGGKDVVISSCEDSLLILRSR